jgi:hypothetical protein
MNCEGFGQRDRGLINAVFQNLPGDSDKNNENPHSGIMNDVPA